VENNQALAITSNDEISSRYVTGKNLKSLKRDIDEAMREVESMDETHH
jgi:hypothetical protein